MSSQTTAEAIKVVKKFILPILFSIKHFGLQLTLLLARHFAWWPEHLKQLMPHATERGTGKMAASGQHFNIKTNA